MELTPVPAAPLNSSFQVCVHVPPPPLGVAVAGAGVAVGGLPAAEAGLAVALAKRTIINRHTMAGTISDRLNWEDCLSWGLGVFMLLLL